MKDKRITRIATVLLVAVNFSLFAWVWLKYYNRFAFRAHRPQGALGALIAYYILYRWLSKLYRGYSIASTSIGETVLSQFISFGISDLLLYVACCLLRRFYVNVIPGAMIVIAQLCASILIIVAAKRMLLSRITPDRTLLIYGEAGGLAAAQAFKGRLRSKYGHLFAVDELRCETDAAGIRAAIPGCDAVIIMDISPLRRAGYVEDCLRGNTLFYVVPEFTDLIVRSSSVKNFLDTPLLRYDYGSHKNRSFLLKRLLDICFSLLFLILLSPLMIACALLIRLEDGGPVFYRQERVTLDGRRFQIYKFRSMVTDAEKDGAAPATANDPRITRTGRWMRRLRVDELPQLLNVLAGQMSFVGPRPERSEHVALYESRLPQFHYRLRVKGGLTGYAQVYGKYNTSPEDKLRLDMLYIENQSLLTDFKIILLTIKTLFRPESTEGFSTADSASIREETREEADADGRRDGDHSDEE